jgi:aldose 1-epimerase
VSASRHTVSRGQLDRHATVTLSSLGADLHATFVPEAGMVGCSLRHGGEELLDMRGGLEDYVRSGATFGIPLLYPWANRLSGFEYTFGGADVRLDRASPLIQLEQNGLPIHGLLAASPQWRVSDTSADGAASLAAELDFGAHPQLLEAFPFPHRLRMEVSVIESSLEIRTTVVAAGIGVPVSFGFHPYLRLPGTPRERWEIELPVRRRLELDAHMIPTGGAEPVVPERAPLGGRSFDDGFAGIEPQPFVLAGGGRELRVTFLEGYPYAQVYSPPEAPFICYEPMTAPTNALVEGGPALPVVPPGGRFSAAFRIAVAEGS